MSKIITETIENYLKAIYQIQNHRGVTASTNALACKLDVAPSSVTNTVKKMAALELVVYNPYQGVTLTDAGQKIALEVLRHHRLVETYLVEKLGVPWDQVHIEAEGWEHVLSTALEKRIDDVLNHPTNDPHGAPIPTQDGTIAQPDTILLADLEPGHAACITEVSDRNPTLLRYCAELGLYPGKQITVISKEHIGDTLKLQVGTAEHIIGTKVAAYIFVSDLNSP